MRRYEWIGLGIVSAAIVGLNFLSAEPSRTQASPPARPEAQAMSVPTPQVQAASTTTASATPAPEVKAPQKAISQAKAANKKGQVVETPVRVQIPLPPEVQPGKAPIPETITVNLKTPFTYTLRAGEASPVLRHTMIDGVRYEWTAGKNTFWQNESPDPKLPVWAAVQADKPLAAPYISDSIPFRVWVAPHTQPGQYEAKIIVALRSNIHLGIPIAITVIK